ncbi:hypothetical protein BH09MYX1_BH09MYX1_54500 [soil metagenome]
MPAPAAPPFIRDVIGIDVDALLVDWRWRIPPRQTPLFVTMLADFIFGAPDGRIWLLSSLEGDYREIARTGAEWNASKSSEKWLKGTLHMDFYLVALQNGLVPQRRQCIGWKLHPRLGGPLEAANLQIFSAQAYCSLTGKLHEQLSTTQE